MRLPALLLLLASGCGGGGPATVETAPVPSPEPAFGYAFTQNGRFGIRNDAAYPLLWFWLISPDGTTVNWYESPAAYFTNGVVWESPEPVLPVFPSTPTTEPPVIPFGVYELRYQIAGRGEWREPVFYGPINNARIVK